MTITDRGGNAGPTLLDGESFGGADGEEEEEEKIRQQTVRENGNVYEVLDWEKEKNNKNFTPIMPPPIPH